MSTVDTVSRFACLDWPEFLDTDFGDVELLAGGLASPGQQIALVGDGKVGKSLFALEMAVSIASGRQLLGYGLNYPSRVLYVDQENGLPDIQMRCRAYGYSAADLKGVAYLSFPEMRPLDTRDGAADLLAAVDHYAPDVIMLDTVSRMIEGAENTSDTWLNLYRLSLKPLKANGKSVIRLDHFGKDADRGARGSSAKTQDIDSVWELTSAGNMLSLKRTHTRRGIGPSYIPMRRLGRAGEAGTTRHVLAGTAEGNPVTSESNEKIRYIMQALDDADIPRSAGRPTVSQALARLGIPARNDVLSEVVKRRKAVPKIGDIGSVATCPQDQGQFDVFAA